jgi:hypothetical protein
VVGKQEVLTLTFKSQTKFTLKKNTAPNNTNNIIKFNNNKTTTTRQNFKPSFSYKKEFYLNFNPKGRHITLPYHTEPI